MQILHAGLPLRRALHRPRDQHRGQVQLLRASRRSQSRTGLRRRMSHAGDHDRRPRRSAKPRQPHRRHPEGRDPQAAQGHAAQALLRRYRGRPAATLDDAAGAQLDVGRPQSARRRASRHRRRCRGCGAGFRAHRLRRPACGAVGRDPSGISVDQIDRGGRADGRGTAARVAERGRGDAALHRESGSCAGFSWASRSCC